MSGSQRCFCRASRAAAAAVLLFPLLLGGCQKTRDRGAGEVSRTRVPPVSAPREHQAFISFLSGEVLLTDNGEWTAADIGAAVSENHRLKVSNDSICEIQFGDTAVVRVQENTEIIVETLYLKAMSVKIGLKMNVGSLLSKVSRMSTGEEFALRTASVAVGVRGTVFLLREEAGREPVVAVKEGTVAVTSSAVDIPALREKIAGRDPRLGRVVDALEEAVVLVEADRELLLSKEELRETGRLYGVVSDDLDGILEELEGDEAAAEETLERLQDEAAALVQAVEREYPAPAAISPLSASELDGMASVKFLDFPEGADDTGEESTSGLTKISVRVTPADAEILVNDRSVGRGAASGIFTPGVELRIRFRRDGYRESSLDVAVERGGDAEYGVILEKIGEPEKDTGDDRPGAGGATPGSEETGAPSGSEGAGGARGGEDTGASVAVRNERLRFIAEPADAEIYVDDEFAARGSVEVEFPIGRRIRVVARKEGYHDAVLDVEVGEGGIGTYPLVLEPDPVIMRLSVSEAPMTGSLTTDPKRIVGVDRVGTIIIYDRIENSIKSIPTGQHTISSTPVLRDGRVLFIGTDRFFTADAEAGHMMTAVPLRDTSRYLGGRKPLPFHDQVLVNDGGILIRFDIGTGEPLGEIPIPGGSRMCPVAFGDRALIINSAGELYAVEESGALEPLFSDPILPAVAVLAAVEGSRLAAVGEDGSLVCVDLERNRVLWESSFSLDPDPDVPLTAEFGPDVFYLTDGELLFGWLVATGEVLFSGVEGVSSPPLYWEGLLAYGTRDGRLVVADGFTAEPLKELDLGERITVRPWLEQGNVLVGTENGSIFVIDPGAMN